MDRTDAPWGTHAPNPRQARVLARAARLKPGPLAKTLRSVCFRRAGGKTPDALFDIEPFPGQRARVHPADNISEKRVFCAPQLWDAQERAELAAAIAAAPAGFVFVDAGANAGFYSLFARSAAQGAGKPIRILAIEPAPDVRGRLQFNLAASGADEVRVFPYAITDRDGPVNLALGDRNLGESRIGEGEGGLSVPGRTLPSILAEAGVDRVDALKIDIEGHERPALEALFREAPRALWPRLILMEVSHDADGAYELCLAHGYRPRLRTRMNAVLELAGPAR